MKIAVVIGETSPGKHDVLAGPCEVGEAKQFVRGLPEGDQRVQILTTPAYKRDRRKLSKPRGKK